MQYINTHTHTHTHTPFNFIAGSKGHSGAVTHPSHTHGHTAKCTRRDTGLLDETDAATALGASAITLQGTMGTSDVSTAPPFSADPPHRTHQAFPKEEFPPLPWMPTCGDCRALILLKFRPLSKEAARSIFKSLV